MIFVNLPDKKGHQAALKDPAGFLPGLCNSHT